MLTLQRMTEQNRILENLLVSALEIRNCTNSAFEISIENLLTTKNK